MFEAKHAWLALGAGVVVWDVMCPESQTLSEGADRALERHPIFTTAAIGYTALHLLNLLPEKADLFKQGLDYVKGS